MQEPYEIMRATWLVTKGAFVMTTNATTLVVPLRGSPMRLPGMICTLLSSTVMRCGHTSRSRFSTPIRGSAGSVLTFDTGDEAAPRSKARGRPGRGTVFDFIPMSK
jgi:hypothetical protein